jgi:hypothetical protein
MKMLWKAATLIFVRMSNQRVDEMPHTTSEAIKSFSHRAVHNGIHGTVRIRAEIREQGSGILMTLCDPLCIDVHASIFGPGMLGDLSRLS